MSEEKKYIVELDEASYHRLVEILEIHEKDRRRKRERARRLYNPPSGAYRKGKPIPKLKLIKII